MTLKRRLWTFSRCNFRAQRWGLPTNTAGKNPAWPGGTRSVTDVETFRCWTCDWRFPKGFPTARYSFRSFRGSRATGSVVETGPGGGEEAALGAGVWNSTMLRIQPAIFTSQAAAKRKGPEASRPTMDGMTTPAQQATRLRDAVSCMPRCRLWRR